MIRICRYTDSDRARWDALVERSSQGTFLFKRDYMEYHSDRFTDYSLLAYDGKERLVGALPATIDGSVATSHAGLTYGGWITDPRHVDASVMLAVMEASLSHMRSDGIGRLIYKPVPTIYHRYPAQDDLYALFRAGAEIEAVAVSSVIDMRAPLPFNNNASRGARYASSHGVELRDDDDIEGFMGLLAQLLGERYGVRPVHSVDEMRLLMSRFPDSIRFHGAYHEGSLVAGVVMYLTDTVAHAQYIGASPQGKELKALPMLFASLIERYSGSHRYFDFGISTEDGGRYLNEGLLRQKSGMGGRGVVYQRMSLSL